MEGTSTAIDSSRGIGGTGSDELGLHQVWQQQQGQQEQQQQQQQFTSTTAPGKVFTCRADLAAHYKTAWHKYNLKRREAGLPVLLETDFLARLAAAQAVHSELRNNNNNRGRGGGTTTTSGGGGGGGGGSGTDHLKGGKQHKKSKKEQGAANSNSNSNAMEGEEKQEIEATSLLPVLLVAGDDQQQQQQEQQPEVVEIDPRQCLFDRHVAASVTKNVERMHRKYGFFLPDTEYLTDVTGLLGYCHEKIKLGHLCLYCHRTFRTARSCQQHMHNKGHTKLRYEAGIDLEDLDVFYDFAEADAAFLNNNNNTNNATRNIGTSAPSPAAAVSDDDNMEEEEEAETDAVGDDEWEDVSDDEEGGDDDDEMLDDNDDDDEMYRGYEEEVARMGFNVTPLGELVFPDGRIIGHRNLRRYYKQRLPQHYKQQNGNNATAVEAARSAAGERLYRGRVYNIGYNGDSGNNNNNNRDDTEKNRALAMAGICPGGAAGRAGKGLLVTTNAAGGAFSQVSVYRYRAAMRKQRRGDFQGAQLHQRTAVNTNRMDKKANRLMNGVSVAHAAR